jgi:hypothetical protein
LEPCFEDPDLEEPRLFVEPVALVADFFERDREFDDLELDAVRFDLLLPDRELDFFDFFCLVANFSSRG